ncbi:hypothetical protein NECAME_17456 [Necator americanus]|uniref:Uncharacterized protein n=1 Tax=Necator americanus TaxID=51031 RepID=W2TQV6_NECAM|nr:hypothetical protein NECAME_17456 [Necator americanus]ETN83412.1 hypothetical protein NECAME_17456 [Necator americanus]
MPAAGAQQRQSVRWSLGRVIPGGPTSSQHLHDAGLPLPIEGGIYDSSPMTKDEFIVSGSQERNLDSRMLWKHDSFLGKTEINEKFPRKTSFPLRPYVLPVFILQGYYDMPHQQHSDNRTPASAKQLALLATEYEVIL